MRPIYLPLCNYDGHFWPKKKCLYYVAVGTGGNFDRYRLRFCPSHAAGVHEDLAERELTVAEDTACRLKITSTQCFSCGEPLEHVGCQVFITGYPTQDERKDYWFQIHGGCSLPDYLKDPYSDAPD